MVCHYWSIFPSRVDTYISFHSFYVYHYTTTWKRMRIRSHYTTIPKRLQQFLILKAFLAYKNWVSSYPCGLLIFGSYSCVSGKQIIQTPIKQILWVEIQEESRILRLSLLHRRKKRLILGNLKGTYSPDEAASVKSWSETLLKEAYEGLWYVIGVNIHVDFGRCLSEKEFHGYHQSFWRSSVYIFRILYLSLNNSIRERH